MLNQDRAGSGDSPTSFEAGAEARLPHGRQGIPAANCSEASAIIGLIGNAAGFHGTRGVAPRAQSVDSRNRVTGCQSQYTHCKPGKPRCEAQHCEKMLPAGREPNDHRDLEIHKGVAGKQDRQIDWKCLSKRHRQNRNCDKLQHTAQRKAAEKIGELDDQYGPKRVTESQRDFVRPLVPPILHRNDRRPILILVAHDPRANAWRLCSGENRFPVFWIML